MQLKKENIKDYEFVQELFKAFKLQTFGDLHDLYMVTDTMLLADFFESYRETLMKKYMLDPAHFMTGPGLSW